MTSIAFVGTSGVGKSLLVRQLAALKNLPCILEGEEGVIPPGIFELIISRKDPLQLFTWFIDKYAKNLTLAKNSKNTILIDGAIISIDAHILEQDTNMHSELYTLKERLNCDADKILLLIASENKLRKNILFRNRSAEEIEAHVQRSLQLQEFFLKLAPTYNAEVLCVDDLDFYNHEDLQQISTFLE